jgi:hypothetical protein
MKSPNRGETILTRGLIVVVTMLALVAVLDTFVGGMWGTVLLFLTVAVGLAFIFAYSEEIGRWILHPKTILLAILLSLGLAILALLSPLFR